MRRNVARRRFLAIAGASGTLLLGSGCTPGSPPSSPATSVTAPPTSAPAKAREPVTVSMGMLKAASEYPLNVATALGYFKEEGVAIKEVNFKSGNDLVAPLSNGEVWVGSGSVTAAFLNAIGRGINLKIVADQGSSHPGVYYQSLVLRQDIASRVADYKDLKGLTLAVTGNGVPTELSLVAALKQGGLTLKDVHEVVLDYPSMFAALTNKSIEGAIISEPWITRAMEEGIAVRWRGTGDFNPGHYFALVLYSPAFVERQPDAARGFMVAYMRGVRTYLDAFLKQQDLDKVIDILVQSTTIKDPAIFRKMSPVYIDPNLRISVDSLKADQDWLVQADFVKQRVDLNSVVDNQFVEHALNKLGKR